MRKEPASSAAALARVTALSRKLHTSCFIWVLRNGWEFSGPSTPDLKRAQRCVTTCLLPCWDTGEGRGEEGAQSWRELGLMNTRSPKVLEQRGELLLAS